MEGDLAVPCLHNSPSLYCTVLYCTVLYCVLCGQGMEGDLAVPCLPVTAAHSNQDPPP